MKALHTEKVVNIIKSLGSYKANLRHDAMNLFQHFGYSTKRQLKDLDSPSKFCLYFPNFNKDKGLYDDWEEFYFLFQFTIEDLNEVLRNKKIAQVKYSNKAYMYLSLRLKESNYTETSLKQIASEINKQFPNPSIIVASFGNYLCFIFTEHRINKTDSTKDVLESINILRLTPKNLTVEQVNALVKVFDIDYIYGKKNIDDIPNITSTVQSVKSATNLYISDNFNSNNFDDEFDTDFEENYQEDSQVLEEGIGIEEFDENFKRILETISNKDVKSLENLRNKKLLEDPVYWYLCNIGKIPLLSKTEEIELANKIKLGGQEGRLAKNMLIIANLRLVIWIAKQYVYKKRLSFLDLIQEGNFGLMKAVEKWNPELGYKFSTYATRWIRQSISRALVNKGKIIRYPVYVNDTLHRIFKYLDTFEQKLTNKQIAEHFKITEDKVKFYLECPRAILGIDNILLNYPDDYNSIDTIESNLINNNGTKMLSKMLSLLSAKERDVIILRFGLNGEREKTLEEIGNQFGVTRERIRQIEARALNKLKQPFRIKRLRNCYGDILGEIDNIVIPKQSNNPSSISVKSSLQKNSIDLIPEKTSEHINKKEDKKEGKHKFRFNFKNLKLLWKRFNK